MIKNKIQSTTIKYRQRRSVFWSFIVIFWIATHAHALAYLKLIIVSLRKCLCIWDAVRWSEPSSLSPPFRTSKPHPFSKRQSIFLFHLFYSFVLSLSFLRISLTLEFNWTMRGAKSTTHLHTFLEAFRIYVSDIFPVSSKLPEIHFYYFL